MTAPAVGLMLPTAASTADGRVDPNRTIAVARRAEEAGFDTVYTGDHILHPRPLLESIVTLSVVAGSTRRVAFGPCVMLIALRAPLLLARQLWTLASFGPGRLRVGVGVGGEYPAEFEATGVDWGERGGRMEAALAEVRAYLAGGSGAGVARGENPDTALTGPAGAVPFLLAGRSRTALRRAARVGDGWVGYLLTTDGFARRRAFLSECRSGAGLDPGPFTTGMLIPFHIGPDRRPARARAAEEWAVLTGAGPFPDTLFAAGPAEDVVEQLTAYWEAGCSEIILAPADQGQGCGEQVELLAETVLPRLRALG